MRALALLALLIPAAAGAASFSERVSPSRFFKGCLHAHTNSHAERGYAQGKGDGDAAPGDVLARYQALGYDFVALTDHNELTQAPAAGLTALPGIELTSSYGPKATPVHVGAVCVQGPAKGVRARSGGAEAVLEATAARARSAGAALIVVNHPTWRRALGRGDLSPAAGFNAIEIASGHPDVEKDDRAAPESSEALWDELLSAGGRIWGVAADDAHDYQDKVQPGEDGLRAPGRAWVEAWADSPSQDALCAALGAGHFYASTGPELSRLTVSGNEFALSVSGPWDERTDRIEFLKRRTGGREAVVKTSSRSAASYLCDGSEGYVRARVTQGGKRAWTQAYRVR